MITPVCPACPRGMGIYLPGITLRWGFWTHASFGPGWWVYKQWKSDIKCPWVALEVDAEVSSVREFTVFWLFFFSGWKHSPSLCCKLWIISMCSSMYHGGYFAVSFFPHSWLVRPVLNAAPFMCWTKLNTVRLWSDFGMTADSDGVLALDLIRQGHGKQFSVGKYAFWIH